jgi:hypothetical protein
MIVSYTRCEYRFSQLFQRVLCRILKSGLYDRFFSGRCCPLGNQIFAILKTALPEKRVGMDAIPENKSVPIWYSAGTTRKKKNSP